MDGTLLDSEPIWDIAMAELAARHGIVLTPRLRASTLGNSLPDALAKVHDAAGVPAADRGPDADGRWMLDRVNELFAQDLPWRPGAREALDLVAGAGIPMVLVTNTVRELTEVALETIGRGRFAATVCGDEVAVGKPAPDPYLRAAELLGVPPAECLAVEDSPTGTQAATAAGCPTLVVESAAPVEPGPLRVFRPSLVGLGLDDIAEAWTGGLAHITTCQNEES
ncbi:HAD family phosphatase [Gordonia sp. zg691]|uniref:HAD family phosphatase n=1 Tax=Gordonia jinghuaiqii TaxID=2758710 RepID=A0A7D7R2Y8_9ACTN|nr:HAD family phosphatase [Gordonia jinghuaiqii]MBD0862381.1 HAD family phosphatase [Gordonia jinghuaiqii]MCR5976486.1 HAD-IA family hydrolase [Gordonia jinghuaiqii]QMT03871.1 HAD family phosphatase [Gordonia jinghuaiqii]